MVPSTHQIALRPVGDIDTDVLRHLRKQLSMTFQCTVEIVEPMEIPPQAYHPKRNQYVTSPILHNLRNFKNADSFAKVLGVIDPDIFVAGMNFIFGEACPGKETAIISLTRLMQEFYSLPGNQELFYHRMTKEAVHELGHLYGMRHCNDSHCVMFFSFTLHDTDIKSQHFCNTHRGILNEFFKENAA